MVSNPIHSIKARLPIPNTRIRTGNVTITEKELGLHKISNPIHGWDRERDYNREEELGYIWYQTQYTTKDRNVTITEKKSYVTQGIKPNTRLRTGNVTITERRAREKKLGYTWYQTQYTAKDRERDYNREKYLGYTWYQTQYTTKDRNVTITERRARLHKTQYTVSNPIRLRTGKDGTDYNRKKELGYIRYQTNTRLGQGNVTITERKSYVTHGIKPNTRLRTGNVTITEKKDLGYTKVSNPIHD
ncbi:unnamed protein product [Mytilus edulis]|uniref:Uncharacterized protein n=1 Tax=Mytilus edulis TaxID=6550 RepID=A0A8S3Q148_MYTED|nr:unnamed protein product [Mytilus edulis]